MKRVGFFLFCALIFVGCNDDGQSSNTAPNGRAVRDQAVAKADRPVNPALTCVGSCGMLVWDDAGYCACDESCETHGDCCANWANECNTQPCPPETYLCGLYCPYGYETDENGCQLCQCKELITCPPVRCEMYCEHGFKKDEFGCEICQCNECSPVLCEIHCPFGFKKDENGCPICDCAPPPDCPQLFCALHCEHGFKSDENGCPICSCVQRTPATGRCVRSRPDACQTDADCATGGCGGELCYNPATGGGYTTCDCVRPQGPACGCVNNSCAWYNLN